MFPIGKGFTHFLPHVGYFRRALRQTFDLEELREIGLMLCKNYEELREGAASKGTNVDPYCVLIEESETKGWKLIDDDKLGEVITPT